MKRTLDIPCTEEEYKAYEQGKNINLCMPFLTDYEKEFILTGMKEEEWKQLFPGQSVINWKYSTL